MKVQLVKDKRTLLWNVYRDESCEDNCVFSKRRFDIEPGMGVTTERDSKHSLLEDRATYKTKGEGVY